METLFKIETQSATELQLSVPYDLVGAFARGGVPALSNGHVMFPVGLLEKSPHLFRREPRYIAVQDVRALMSALGGRHGVALTDVPQTDRTAWTLDRVLAGNDPYHEAIRKHAARLVEDGKLYFRYLSSSGGRTLWEERKVHSVEI